ncbi:peptidase domain-containing ABC transporter [Flavobacterium psychroterrae]|uniref:Peptidase domain-containing ABC transporter n=1 Tax=Flavobacterium psychroterrae TaxID=2133767 RepID=A0ABS5PIH3_9FLAO|nr:peptidase domain-containing ABC transporter [Flavobacterium psychroterrae]MBS7234124.1 peptidase domain-containing ABC transporter [Flavobacterium psychroterrae]
MTFFNFFPFVAQHDAMDCGPACLAMISKFYGKSHSLQYLRDVSFLTREGVSLSGLNEAAENIGLESMGVKITLSKLLDENPFPCIVFWNNAHFVVLYGIRKKFFSNKRIFQIADPAKGYINISEKAFLQCWNNNADEGVAFLVYPTEKFYKMEPKEKEKYQIKYLLTYLNPYRKELLQLFFSLALGSAMTLVFPFLTASLIDKGVNQKSLDIVFIILLAQIFLFAGSVIIEIVRNWLVIYIGARINIAIISDFFKKIMKLPLHFFDTKFLGDFYQRIQDHSRIEHFLTSQSLTTFFSLINFLIFFIVLLRYDYKILIVYVTLTLLAVFWSRIFLKNRERLDYFRFKSNALNQQAVNEMIHGIQEIKLNNFENYKINEWEKVQIEVFDVNLKILKLDQLQLTGFDFINQLKNIIVTYLAAREVIIGNITLGSMLGISYIIGQMNSPVNQLIVFFRSLQDAQLSMLRLTEVQNHKEEEEKGQRRIKFKSGQKGKGGINIRNLNFQFEGPHSPLVLKNINFNIPAGKTTAIVGASGGGKTTLMKLLLLFYKPTNGTIKIDQHDLSQISPLSWRKNCGVVMQDGYIFADTIERNIATQDINIDKEKLANAIKIANIGDFIESLPLKEKTIIGATGNGISGGQRQRILLARAVYKEPQYVFFDEATSALDTENEKIIHDHLGDFFKNKTVLIIAHRLSTVKHADQIVVLKEGEIMEIGNHRSLLKQKGTYYNLVKNQLNLDKI